MKFNIKDYILASQNSYSEYEYAENILGCRWTDAEFFIMKDPECSSNYSRNILEGRWIEAKPFIMKDSAYVYYYA